jgi:hypothetical protein
MVSRDQTAFTPPITAVGGNTIPGSISSLENAVSAPVYVAQILEYTTADFKLRVHHKVATRKVECSHTSAIVE